MSVFLYCHIPTNSLFQGKPLSRESFPGNHFSMELFRKISFQRVNCPDQNRFQDGPFSVGLYFSKNSFQRNCFTGTMSWNGPCLQRNCFNKNFFQRNFFQRNSFLKNCFYKTTFEGIILNNLFFCPVSLLRGYLTIIPRNCFQGPFFHMSLIHISKPHTKAPI